METIDQIFLSYEMDLSALLPDSPLLSFKDFTPTQAIRHYEELLNKVDLKALSQGSAWFSPDIEKLILTADTLGRFQAESKGPLEEWIYGDPQDFLKSSLSAKEFSDLPLKVESLIMRELKSRSDEVIAMIEKFAKSAWIEEDPSVYAKLKFSDVNLFYLPNSKSDRRLLSALFESPAQDVFILPPALACAQPNPFFVTDTINVEEGDDAAMLENLKVLANEMNLIDAVNASRALGGA